MYPLIKALYPYGTICVLSSNYYIKRLISEDYQEGGFRNIRVISVPDQDVDTALAEDGYYKDKYDFVIFDNVAYTNADKDFVIVTSRVTEEYLQDLLYITDDPNVHIFRFGEAPKKQNEKPTKSKSAKPSRKNKGDVTISIDEHVNDAEEVETGYNEDGTIKNKFHEVKSDEQILNEKLRAAATTVIPFASFKDIEDMESRWILPPVSDKLAKQLYKVLKDDILVDERQFLKTIKIPDTGGLFIDGASLE